MSRDAKNSSNGFVYQRLYFCDTILKELKTKKDEEIKIIKCIEEGNISGNEYEDFTFVRNDKITTYQIKYKNGEKNDKESITKDCGFISAFVPYFCSNPDLNKIDKIYYIVAKNKNDNSSNLQKILTYTPEIIYKYMILFASGNNLNGNVAQDIICKKYDEVKNDYIIEYNNDIITNPKKEGNVLFEKFKKIMKDTNADIIKNHIGKYIFQDGYIYTELIKGMNQQIKEIIGHDINNNVISNNNIIINYIRMKIFDELSNNSFKTNSLFKIDMIQKPTRFYIYTYAYILYIYLL